MDFNKSQYDQAYLKENYKQIAVAFPKDFVEELTAYCKRVGVKRQTLIRQLLEEEMERFPDGRTSS